MKGKRDNPHMGVTLKVMPIMIKLFLDKVSSPSVEDVNTKKAAWAFHVSAISATGFGFF